MRWRSKRRCGSLCADPHPPAVVMSHKLYPPPGMLDILLQLVL